VENGASINIKKKFFFGSDGPVGLSPKQMEDHVALFDALFPSTLVDQIVQQSNLYAAQQVRNLIFFAIYFFPHSLGTILEISRINDKRNKKLLNSLIESRSPFC